ncbi:hypothetical protein DAPPUDRAFT_118131 [Daphnia pulex]|uniref:Uncharacterized protein n=1 Tax=Daphnia pulex TaxID=6669 RepID=E9HUU9_DAPPU|nr:hypothetical protein DAPPUDRAFT_118131 [Daphnia pulex]|eukprot:EFX64486.1 hypothetical protein DAPPUDRAFT_118131 [Daphnia pulex]
MVRVRKSNQPHQNRQRNNVHNIPPYRAPVVAPVVNRQPTPRQRQDPPYYDQPEEVEMRIQQESGAASFCLTYLIGPKVNDTLVSKGKVTHSASYDLQVQLEILRVEMKSNPSFLPSRLSPSLVKRVTRTRNAVYHNNWSVVQRDSTVLFAPLIELADCLGEPEVANDIQEILNSINAGDSTGGVSFVPFRFPSLGYDNMAAFGLHQIIETLMTKYVAKKGIWQNLNARKPVGSPPPSLDIYYNIKDMTTDVVNDPDYLGIGGNARNDRLVLTSVKELRLDLAHGRYENTYNGFELKLANVIELLPLLGAPEAAVEVGLIRDILVELKRTGQQVDSLDPGQSDLVSLDESCKSSSDLIGN